MKELEGKKVLIGVTGGIATYKACDVVSSLKKLGAEVHVIMTENATKFVTPLTFRSLSQNRVIVDMFNEEQELDTEHIALAQNSDLILVVPATVNTVGKVANGIADNMLTTTIMATECPVVFALAMNTKMYNNSIFQSNVEKLKEHNYLFIDAISGRLACGDIGKGKLEKVENVVEFVKSTLTSKHTI